MNPTTPSRPRAARGRPRGRSRGSAAEVARAVVGEGHGGARGAIDLRHASSWSSSATAASYSRSLRSRRGFLESSNFTMAITPAPGNRFGVGGSCSSAMLSNQLENSGHELRRHRHGSISRLFEGRLILGDRFLVRLRVIGGKHAMNAVLIPARWKMLRVHRLFFLRRRRSACFAFGVKSYAVNTNTEFGSGAGRYTTRR